MRAHKDRLSAQQTTPLAVPQGGPHRSDTAHRLIAGKFAKFSAKMGSNVPQTMDLKLARVEDAQSVGGLAPFTHVLKIEKQFDYTAMLGLPCMLDAVGRCPPEDVGGPPGYENYLAAIKDPHHPDHEHLLEWGPEAFDPKVFDRKAIEHALDKLAQKWEPKPRRK